MYNIDVRQFILRQSAGDIWNFYHDNRYGICYSTLTKRNTWTNPVYLHKNAYNQFYADMDLDDRFHLLFQDSQGGISYTYMDKDTVKTIPILSSKTPSIYNKHLYLIPTKNNIHFFYILHRESSPILAHQILSEGNLGNPRVIDYVTDSNKPYSIIMDKAQNLFVFYQSTDGKYLQLGCRKYNATRKTWGEFHPITKYEGNCDYPEIVMDSTGILHLCYQRQNQKLYELVYIQKLPDKNTWTNETVVHSSAHDYENASIFWVNDNVIVYWVKDDVIYYCLGSQSGNAWEKPAKYTFPSSQKFTCLSYKTNNLYESDKISVKMIPGSLAGGLRFAFYQFPSDNGENLSADELRTLILDSLKMLKDGLQTLKDDEEGLRDDLNRCMNRQEEIEKELIKYTVKLELIESQANNVKSLNKRLDSITVELNALKSKWDIPLPQVEQA